MSIKLCRKHGAIKGALAAAVGIFALTGAASVAQAIPVSGFFILSIYQASTPGNVIGSLEQQAGLGNPLISNANLKDSGTYNGAIDFVEGGSGGGNIGTFLTSASGTTAGISAGTLGKFSI